MTAYREGVSGVMPGPLPFRHHFLPRTERHAEEENEVMVQKIKERAGPGSSATRLPRRASHIEPSRIGIPRRLTASVGKRVQRQIVRRINAVLRPAFVHIAIHHNPGTSR